MENKKKQNLSSFDSIFALYYPRLCDYARSMVGNEQHVEDLVQDAFVVFLEQREKISSHPLAIKSYLYSTVKHSSLNTFRHSNVVTRFINYVKTQDVDENSFADAIIISEVVGKIHHAINKLPQGSATILKLYYLEGLKNAEIAKQLDISIHTVKSQKQRGIRILKQSLDPEYFRVFLFIYLM